MKNDALLNNNRVLATVHSMHNERVAMSYYGKEILSTVVVERKGNVNKIYKKFPEENLVLIASYCVAFLTPTRVSNNK